jgi:hypothetical protein
VVVPGLELHLQPRSGDDLVVFHDLCEIADFTVFIGGNGNDELVLPVPVEELPENVEIYEFETITVDPTRAYTADCHVPPPTE